MKKGSHQTEEAKRKCSENASRSWLGKKRPARNAEYRYKLGNAHRGKKHTEEHKKNISLAMNRGENHWAWKKDRNSLVKRQERNDSAYHDWRLQVYRRDNYKCKISNQDCVGRIEAHHILGWTLYPELRYDVSNGITLCHAHHPRRRNDEQRLIPVFKTLVGSNN